MLSQYCADRNTGLQSNIAVGGLLSTYNVNETRTPEGVSIVDVRNLEIPVNMHPYSLPSHRPQQRRHHLFRPDDMSAVMSSSPLGQSSC